MMILRVGVMLHKLKLFTVSKKYPRRVRWKTDIKRALKEKALNSISTALLRRCFFKILRPTMRSVFDNVDMEIIFEFHDFALKADVN